MMRRRMLAAAGRDRIPTDGLVAWYTMDNISGSTLVDEMGNYNGTIYGATPGSGFLDFDGTNDRVENSYPSKVQEFSWVVDINADVLGDLDTIINTVDGYSAVYLRFASGGLIQFGVYNGAYTRLDAPVSASTRYRVVSQHDGSDTQIWINGSLIDSALGVGAIVYQGPEAGRRIGAGNALITDRHYNGKIFEFLEYNRLLTSSEIAEHFS